MAFLIPAAGDVAKAIARAPAAGVVRNADVQTLLGEIRRPGASAVLLNVWATWCDPCRAEMPLVLKFYREHRAEGLRLVLVSADDEAERDKVAGFLAALGVDFPTWLKRGDDMKFIDAIDKRWSGALPASFFFDASGRLARHCYGEVSSAELTTAWNHLMLHRKGRAHDPTHTPQADRHH